MNCLHCRWGTIMPVHSEWRADSTGMRKPISGFTLSLLGKYHSIFVELDMLPLPFFFIMIK